MRFSSTHFKASFSALLFAVCSHSVFANGDLKINDGEHIEAGEYPYFSALTYDHILQNWPSVVNCGGVIIAGRYFLSATHCFAPGDDPIPWWVGKAAGNQFPPQIWNDPVNANIVVGLEKVFSNNQKPEIFNQKLIISGAVSQWEDKDWMYNKDIIVLDLEKYIKKDLLLDKAVYLGNYETMTLKQSARIMGFGSTRCLGGDCDLPQGDTDYLLQTTVSLEKDCGLTSNQIPTDFAWWPQSMDELVCSTSNKFSIVDNDVGYSNANHGDSGC